MPCGNCEILSRVPGKCCSATPCSAMPLIVSCEVTCHFASFRNLDLLRKGSVRRTEAPASALRCMPTTPCSQTLPLGGQGAAAEGPRPARTRGRVLHFQHPLHLLRGSSQAQLLCNLQWSGQSGPASLHFPWPTLAAATPPAQVTDSASGSTPGCIKDSRSSYVTRSVHVRYNDEVFDLNEGATFRVSAPLTAFEADAVRLLLTLHHAEAEVVQTPDIDAQGLLPRHEARIGIRRKGLFAPVAPRILALSGLLSGSIHGLYPVIFDMNHLAGVDVQVHAGVTGVAFQAPPVAALGADAAAARPGGRPDSQTTPPSQASSGITSWLRRMTVGSDAGQLHTPQRSPVLVPPSAFKHSSSGPSTRPAQRSTGPTRRGASDTDVPTNPALRAASPWYIDSLWRFLFANPSPPAVLAACPHLPHGSVKTAADQVPPGAIHRAHQLMLLPLLRTYASLLAFASAASLLSEVRREHVAAGGTGSSVASRAHGQRTPSICQTPRTLQHADGTSSESVLPPRRGSYSRLRAATVEGRPAGHASVPLDSILPLPNLPFALQALVQAAGGRAVVFADLHVLLPQGQYGDTRSTRTAGFDAPSTAATRAQRRRRSTPDFSIPDDVTDGFGVAFQGASVPGNPPVTLQPFASRCRSHSAGDVATALLQEMQHVRQHLFAAWVEVGSLLVGISDSIGPCLRRAWRGVAAAAALRGSMKRVFWTGHVPPPLPVLVPGEVPVPVNLLVPGAGARPPAADSADEWDDADTVPLPNEDAPYGHSTANHIALTVAAVVSDTLRQPKLGAGRGGASAARPPPPPTVPQPPTPAQPAPPLPREASYEWSTFAGATASAMTEAPPDSPTRGRMKDMPSTSALQNRAYPLHATAYAEPYHHAALALQPLGMPMDVSPSTAASYMQGLRRLHGLLELYTAHNPAVQPRASSPADLLQAVLFGPGAVQHLSATPSSTARGRLSQLRAESTRRCALDVDAMCRWSWRAFDAVAASAVAGLRQLEMGAATGRGAPRGLSLQAPPAVPGSDPTGQDISDVPLEDAALPGLAAVCRGAEERGLWEVTDGSDDGRVLGKCGELVCDDDAARACSDLWMLQGAKPVWEVDTYTYTSDWLEGRQVADEAEGEEARRAVQAITAFTCEDDAHKRLFLRSVPAEEVGQAFPPGSPASALRTYGGAGDGLDMEAAVEGVPVLDDRTANCGVHVIVMQNGMNGTMHDMRSIRAYLKVLYPACLVFTARKNQGTATEDSLITAGQRLAEEVDDFITKKVLMSGLKLARLSFVAFSLGGVITRLALRHPSLAVHAQHLHAFITLASPHLGMAHGNTALFDAGVFFVRKWRRSVALEQLSLQDEQVRAACLLRLLSSGWNTTSEEEVANRDSLLALITSGKRGQHLRPLLGAVTAAARRSSANARRTGAITAGLSMFAAAAAPAMLRKPGRTIKVGRSSASNMSLNTQELDLAAQAAAGAEAETSDVAEGAASGEGDSPVEGTTEGVEDAALAGVADAVPLPADTDTPHSVPAGEVEGGAETPTPPASDMQAVPPHPQPTHGEAALYATPTYQALAAAGLWCGPEGAMLRHFKHILLVGSPQDKYTPFHSCRCELLAGAREDPEVWGDLPSLLEGVWEGVDMRRVSRLSATFKLSERALSMDAVIGREAHLAFLESRDAAAWLALALAPVFETPVPGRGYRRSELECPHKPLASTLPPPNELLGMLDVLGDGGQAPGPAQATRDLSNNPVLPGLLPHLDFLPPHLAAVGGGFEDGPVDWEHVAAGHAHVI